MRTYSPSSLAVFLILVLGGTNSTIAARQPEETQALGRVTSAPAAEPEAKKGKTPGADGSVAAANRGEAPAEPVADQSSLMSEESLARFQQLLQRKPLHNPGLHRLGQALRGAGPAAGLGRGVRAEGRSLAR